LARLSQVVRVGRSLELRRLVRVQER
jgi:hypothetical protein